MLLTGPGVPFIYYGEEIGMVGDKPDPDIRTPMQWGPGPNAGFAAEGAEPWRAVNAGFEKVNVDTQAGEPGSLLGLYRELIALRAAHPALSRGSYTPVETGNKAVYAFAREEAGGAAVVVVVNLGASAVKEYGLTVAQSGLRGGVNARALLPAAAEPAPVRIDGRGGFEAWKPLAELGPRAVCIIELRAR
jgi:glycosidase